jgi:hypothetical protein
MQIEKQLPFGICESCGEFILDVEEKAVWHNDGHTHLVLIVRCKNEDKCKMLKENLKALEDKSNED